MDELLEDFRKETGSIITELTTLLEDIEEEFAKKERLNEFSQVIDRVMGSAQSLNSFGYDQDEIKKLADFAELCKQIGYRGANVGDPEFYDLIVSFLFDAVESMDKLLKSVGEDNQVEGIGAVLVSAFLNRLKWIIEQLNSRDVEKTDYLAGKGDSEVKSQSEIDDLLTSLGVQ